MLLRTVEIVLTALQTLLFVVMFPGMVLGVGLVFWGFKVPGLAGKKKIIRGFALFFGLPLLFFVLVASGIALDRMVNS